VLKFIAKLFADETTRPAPTTRANLSLHAMEDRYAPAGVPLRSFDPQPEPPSDTQAAVIAIQPDTRGIIIVGG
jgi:hypothetical protein